MLHKEIENVAKQHGFIFKDLKLYESYFNSWRIYLEKEGVNYSIEKDGRDGWLFFYRINATGDDILYQVESYKFDDSDFIGECEKWFKTV